MNDQRARSIIEEYTNNIVDGATSDGDFFIATHKKKFLEEMSNRLRELGWTCVDTTNELNEDSDYCTTRYQPDSKWTDWPDY